MTCVNSQRVAVFQKTCYFDVAADSSGVERSKMKVVCFWPLLYLFLGIEVKILSLTRQFSSLQEISGRKLRMHRSIVGLDWLLCLSNDRDSATV